MVCTHTHTHTHTQEYYSVIKNEIMLFEATWIDLEIFMLSKVSQTKTNHDNTYVKSKK